MHLDHRTQDNPVTYERDEIMLRMCNKFRIYPEDDGLISRSKLCSLGDVDIGTFSGAPHTGIAWNSGRDFDEDYYFFIFLSAGEAEIWNNQYRISIRDGQGVFLKKRDIFKYNISRSNHILVKFPVRYLHNMSTVNLDGFIFDRNLEWTDLVRNSVEIIAKMETLYQNVADFGKMNILSGIMMLLDEAGFKTPRKSIPAIRASEMITSLNEYWYDKNIDAKAFSRAHNMSVRSLHLCFSEANTSFGSELMRARVKNAARLIQNPFFKHTPLIEIALKCGFADDSHFRKRFKEEMGVTPSEYRLRSTREPRRAARKHVGLI